MAGRPSKLTDELCQEICDYIKEGIPPSTAAVLSGISRTSYHDWINRGKSAKRKNKFTEFLNKINNAKAYAERQHLHRIIKSKDWKAQKYLLTLLNKDYALPDKIEVKADVKSESMVTIFKPNVQETILKEEGYDEGDGD